ncbi:MULTISPECIES: hypothetical protein [unclassified Novosphingobium]|uniref:hypothetical protein n=1 Tax=unclassified Novosphingobium TaxID=2644732 RepID=UPI000D3058D5|nr:MULTISPECIES: hypothetical protein [unclassified Novosphingobium]PTR08664.1 hypothetical protein C8K11_111110 [Novosphingobium sp. GV055]PUB01387.1 hypothetical protein C8K12_111110 [Novosphingobium sp. GV061]PUB16961.1 hypothetical protein C8K14_111110 [Novosphingobium sp. GV079]PUB39984.1 hypothetical protein C8K10_111110 [Novosphingobium sp. GV027]
MSGLGIASGVGAILSRWRLGLILGLILGVALLVIGMTGAALHYRSAYQAEVLGRANDLDGYKQAQQLAEQRARDAIAHQESTWRMRAQIEDTKHATDLADARAAAERHIADNRVQPKAAVRAPGGAAADAQGDGAGIRQDLPAAGVVVSEDDVRACTEVTAYALSLRDWALGLNDPAPEQ